MPVTGQTQTTDSLDDAATDSLDDAATDSLDDAATDSLDDAATDSQDNAPTDSQDDTATDSQDNAATDSLDDAATDSLDNAPADSLDNAPTDSQDNAATDSQDNAPADSTDNAPIELEADSAELVHDERIVYYRGNVIVNRRHPELSQQLRGEVATVTFDEHKTVTHLRVTGSPALWRREAPGEEPHNGKAASMEYFVDQQRILFTGNAELTTANSSLRGAVIEYHTSTSNARVLSAEKPGEDSGDDRVRVIFRADPDD